MKAIWNDQVIAESDETVVVEGNHYFPPNTIKKDFFETSTHTSACPWKGVAKYYTLNVGGKRNENAAWFYDSPSDAATKIKDHVAFWKGVRVQ